MCAWEMSSAEQIIKKWTSDGVGPLTPAIRRYKDSCLQMWWETKPDPPAFERSFTAVEQKTFAADLNAFIDRASGRIKDYPASERAPSSTISSGV